MNQSSFNTAAPQENLLRQIISKFLPYWPVFLVLLFIIFTGTFIYLKWATPIYSSTATILINDEKKGSEDPRMVESLNFFASKKIVENEIEVIKSRSLLTEVIKELKLMGPIFEMQSLKYTSAYQSSPIEIDVQSIVQSEDLKRNEYIQFYYISDRKKVKIDSSLFSLNQWVSTPYGILKFSNNLRKTKEAKYPLCFSLVHLNEKLSDLSSRISVLPVSKLSTIVRLEIEDEVPQRANDILNGLAKAYYNSSLNNKRNMAENTLLFIDGRITVVKNELDSLERLIQLFKTQRGIVNLSAQGQQFIENVSSNDQKIGEINMQVAVLDQVEKYVISKDNKAGIVPSTLGITDPVLTNLLQKLYEAETKYEKLRGLTAENNPMLLSVAGEIEKIRPGILENIKNQRQGLEAGKFNINSTNRTYNSVLSAIPQKEQALLGLTRQQSFTNNVYTFLLQKREETALSYSPDIAGNKIIDPAAASIEPIKPNKVIMYLFALTFSITSVITIIMGRELFSSKILYRSEIESLISYPIIGEIAYENSAKPMFLAGRKMNLVAEQFRRLRASLSHIGVNNNSRKILITSEISGEGKSFIAANLGLTLAIAGKKVILLDLDLSNPSLSNEFEIQAEIGITQFLQGKYSAEEIIRDTKENPNLFIIPSGYLPDNPSELIVNGKILELFSYLEATFDYIIIDTAPVGTFSDAYMLSPITDNTIFVVRHNFTPKAVLQKLSINNQTNELKNVKIVFNSVKQRGFSKTIYGYGYSYQPFKYSDLKKAEFSVTKEA